MDEIDAALDFKNVSIVANYIKVIAQKLIGTSSWYSFKVDVLIAHAINYAVDCQGTMPW